MSSSASSGSAIGRTGTVQAWAAARQPSAHRPGQAARCGLPVAVGGHGRILDRHEVHDLGHPARRQEPRHQDGGIGQVHLPGPCLLPTGARADLPPPRQSSRDANTLGESNRGRHIQSTVPSVAPAPPSANPRSAHDPQSPDNSSIPLLSLLCGLSSLCRPPGTRTRWFRGRRWPVATYQSFPPR